MRAAREKKRPPFFSAEAARAKMRPPFFHAEAAREKFPRGNLRHGARLDLQSSRGEYEHLQCDNRTASPYIQCGRIANPTERPPPFFGATKLNSGATKLNSGATKLNSGATKLNSGATKMNSNETNLRRK